MCLLQMLSVFKHHREAVCLSFTWVPRGLQYFEAWTHLEESWVYSLRFAFSNCAGLLYQQTLACCEIDED